MSYTRGPGSAARSDVRVSAADITSCRCGSSLPAFAAAAGGDGADGWEDDRRDKKKAFGKDLRARGTAPVHRPSGDQPPESV